MNWFKDAVIYHILIDRFSRGLMEDFKNSKPELKPDFLGGNIRGIIERLDYLKELGVNCLWLSPFYETNAYHGYHVTNYFEVDPHFGTKKDLKELIEKAHKQGIKIIADFVPNHCSYKHRFFQEALKNEESKYRGWFYFNKATGDYESFLDLKELPKLNLNHKPAKEYLLKTAGYWISEFDLDGYRLDHAIGVPDKFWKQLKKKVKSLKKDFLLIGEVTLLNVSLSDLKTFRFKYKLIKYLLGKIFNNHEEWIMRGYAGLIDGCLDYTFFHLIEDLICKKDFKAFKKLRNHYGFYPKKFLLPSFLDNHDVDRFIYKCKDIDKLKISAMIQFCLSEPCIIYYGTEAGLSQDKSIWAKKHHGDLQARMLMPWDEREQDTELLMYYKSLIRLRKNHKSLSHGKLKIKRSEEIIIFEKRINNERITCIINLSNKDFEYNLKNHELLLSTKQPGINKIPKNSGIIIK